MQKRLLLFIVASFLLINYVSAGMYDFVYEQSKLEENTFAVEDEVCSSLQYKLFSNFVKDFVFETESKNTDEHFYLIIRDNDCELSFEVTKETDLKPDIFITGNWDEEETYLEDREMKIKSFKGLLFNNLIEEYV